MKFKFYRYFLNTTDQIPLFGSEVPRSDIAMSFFNEKHDVIDNLKSQIVYIPAKRIEKYIIAKIGKKSQITLTDSPESGFQQTTSENWPYSLVLINTDIDPINGQMILFEDKPSIFPDTLSVLRKFSEAVNLTLANDNLYMNVNPITSDKYFWDFVSENAGEIEEVCFNLAAPNLFKLNNSLNQELTEVQQEFDATEVEFTIKNKDNKLKIPEENELIKQSVDYVKNGGGEFKLKAKKRVYSSKESVKTVSYDVNLELLTDSPDMVKTALNQLFDSNE